MPRRGKRQGASAAAAVDEEDGGAAAAAADGGDAGSAAAGSDVGGGDGDDEEHDGSGAAARADHDRLPSHITELLTRRDWRSLFPVLRGTTDAAVISALTRHREPAVRVFALKELCPCRVLRDVEELWDAVFREWGCGRWCQGKMGHPNCVLGGGHIAFPSFCGAAGSAA
jgi:hypothetical protein